MSNYVKRITIPIYASDVFSRRERIIIEERLKGKSTEDIGKQYGVTAARIDYHIRKIIVKLNEEEGPEYER